MENNSIERRVRVGSKHKINGLVKSHYIYINCACMKRGLLLYLLFFGLNACAGDTLTRAQVYNFSVGDTFDYRDHSYSYRTSEGTIYSVDSSLTYSRYAITNVFYSADSSIKYIQRIKLFPNLNSLDTIILQNLSRFEVYLDTSICFSETNGIISMDTTSEYHGRSTNEIDESFCSLPSLFQNIIFSNDLGIVWIYQYEGGCGPCNGWDVDTTNLIYFTKGAETWGTPYYNFTTEVQPLSLGRCQIELQPTINNGQFNVKTSQADLLPITLNIYDVAGREVKQIYLNNLNNNVSIESRSAGVYIWEALSGNQLIQTGKMIGY